MHTAPKIFADTARKYVVTGNKPSRWTHISITGRRLGEQVDVKEAIALLLYPTHELLRHIDLARTRDKVQRARSATGLTIYEDSSWTSHVSLSEISTRRLPLRNKGSDGIPRHSGIQRVTIHARRRQEPRFPACPFCGAN